jgi:hypothetical protein
MSAPDFRTVLIGSQLTEIPSTLHRRSTSTQCKSFTQIQCIAHRIKGYRQRQFSFFQKTQEVNARSKRFVIDKKNLLWPSAVIPYVFDDSVGT